MDMPRSGVFSVSSLLNYFYYLAVIEIVTIEEGSPGLLFSAPLWQADSAEES